MSKKPELTILPATSSTSVPGGAASAGPTALTLPSTISTSSGASSPCVLSITRPPRSSKLFFVIPLTSPRPLLTDGCSYVQTVHEAVQRALEPLAHHAALGHFA